MQEYREGQRLQGSDGQIYVVTNGVPTPATAPMSSLSSIIPPNPRIVADKARERGRQAAADARAAAEFKWKQEQHDKEAATEHPLGDAHLTGEEYLRSLPEDVSAQVKALASGRMAFPTGKAASSPYWQQRLSAVAQYDPEFDSINYNARAATRKDFTSGKSSANIKALNTAIGHLGQLGDQISGTASHGGFPGATLVNSVENALSRSSGSSGVTKFDQTAGALSGELTQVYRQSGGAEADIQRYLKEMDSSQSAEQKKAAIANMAGLLKSRLDAINDQYVKGMGTSAQPLQVLDPHATQVLQKYMPGFNASGDAPPSGGNGNGGGSPPAPGGTDPGSAGPGVVAASGDTRYESNDRLKSNIDSLISQGKFETANAILRKASLPAISPMERQKIVQWQKANPGVAYNASQIGRDVPLTAMQSIAGSPLGAGAARFANSATAGLVGLAAGAKGQGALDAMSAAHPDASVLGDVTGGILGSMGAEAGIAARLGGRGAAWLAPRLGDAAYGGLSGFNQAQDGEGAQGALLGAGAGVAGGALGEGAAKAAGAVFRGVQSPAVRLLREQGIPLTVGQTVGDSGTLGRTVKGVEDAMTSIPGVGNMIDARRLEGMQGFNKAAFNAGGAPIGAQIDDIGAAGVAKLNDAKSAAYSQALDPASIDVSADPNLIPGMNSAALSARDVPQVGGDIADALQYRIGGGVDNQGMMSGRDFQEAYRGLARDGRAAKTGSYANEFSGTMREGQDLLAGALEAQNPGAYQGFLNANQANRNLNVLADAVNQAKATGGVFTPHQLNMKDAASTVRLNGNIASASGNRPFFDLTEAGQSVLPSKLGDSGTLKRMLVGGGATGLLSGGGAWADGSDGAQMGAGGGLLMSLALGLGGTKGAQRVLTDALVKRPDLAVEIGNALSRSARLGGTAGAGVLTPLAIRQ